MTRCVQSFSVSAELMFLEEQPYLLLEERWRDFEALRRVMIEEVQKQKLNGCGFGHCRPLMGKFDLCRLSSESLIAAEKPALHQAGLA
jgi:hypothetical protein